MKSYNFYLYCFRGGNGLDWFSSIRCPHGLEQIKPIQSQSHTKRNELKTSNLSQGNPVIASGRILPARLKSYGVFHFEIIFL